MKQSKYIRKCGPYEVHSISQDEHGVRLEIYPAFPQYEEFPDGIPWAIHRLKKRDGGGPSIFTAMGLAREFEEWLNQFYEEEEIISWKRTLGIALKKVRDKASRQFEKAMARQEKFSANE